MIKITVKFKDEFSDTFSQKEYHYLSLDDNLDLREIEEVI